MYPLRNRTLDRMRGTGLKSADAWMEAFNPTIAGISGSILQILSQRWHPIQDLLTQLGIKMKELWVESSRKSRRRSRVQARRRDR